MSNSEIPVDDAPEDGPETTEGPALEGTRRDAVRLTTVYGGRICQHGKAYACIISDVSAGGAKVRLKDPNDYRRITRSGDVQLIFERLSDYNALNTVVAWEKPDEHAIGLRFIDSELRCRMVIKRLMPNRWRMAQAQADAADEAVDNENGE